jgi:DNA-binding LacI/PurR family transcriptional regulator
MKPRQTVDMDSLAQRIGVSKTTVHYALHNTGRVSGRLRKRILDLARKLNYRPNLLARSLRSKRTSTIGVVAVHLSSTYHARVVEGIEDAARSAGRSILLACSYSNPERERDAVQLLLDKGVDGVIVAPSDPADTSPNAALYRQLVDNGRSIVFVDRHIPGLNVASVATDNVLGAYWVGQHLLRLGRRRFGMVIPALHGPRPTSVRGRIDGFNRALNEAGAKPAILIGPETLDNTSDGAYGAMRRFLAGKPRVDALFASNDGLAYGTVRAIVENGARVPDDIAVAGFDDQEPSAFFQPPLTTVRQPMRDIGTEAVRLLMRQLEEPDALVKQHILLEPQLIVRESCGTKHETGRKSHV